MLSISLSPTNRKSRGTHWEVYTMQGSGKLAVWMPGNEPSNVVSEVDIADNRWHYVAAVLETNKVSLYVDGKRVGDASTRRRADAKVVAGPLTVGKAAANSNPADCHGCDGAIEEVRISNVARPILAVPTASWKADDATIGLWQFGQRGDAIEIADASAFGNPLRIVKQRLLSLDKIDRASFRAGPAPGDSPAEEVTLEPGEPKYAEGPTDISLDGRWGDGRWRRRRATPRWRLGRHDTGIGAGKRSHTAPAASRQNS